MVGNAGPFAAKDPSVRRVARISVILVAIASALPAEDLAAWAHRKTLYYDTSPAGAGVPGDVTGFPVLVRLAAPDFPFAEAMGNGQDLRFAKPDGTAMRFQIDSYDSAAGQAAIWVLADTVKGGYRGPLLDLHWGNRSAPVSPDTGRVFTGANGFAAVWHLGGRYPTARPNSVPGGMDAVAGNYDADEQVRGLIGFADSLDGGNPGDHLQTWQPLDTLAKAFTFSIWAYPTAVAAWSRLMDFGNGSGQDNLVLGRAESTDSLRFENWNGTGKSIVSAPGAIALGEWQLFAVTVAGKTARLYRNGIELASGELADSIARVPRNSQYIGRGNWPDNAYFRGMIDEPQISAAARSADWLKLAYANQKPDPALPSFQVPCMPRFGVSGDTAVAEGTELTLSGQADCADEYAWSVLSGPSLRLIDAEVKDLPILVPRVTADSALVLRFSARFGDSVRNASVRIAIQNAIPEPEFSLAKEAEWSGGDSLLIVPKWANLAELRDSGMPDVHLSWTLTGLAIDTVWRPDGILLLPSPDQGKVEVALCVDNGGARTCQATAVTVGIATGLARRRPATVEGPMRSGYGADGRHRSARGAFPRLYALPSAVKP